MVLQPQIPMRKGRNIKNVYPKLVSQSFFINSRAAEGSASAKQLESSCKHSSIDSCTNRTLVINAEIIWALDVVMLKLFNSSWNKNELFATMFCDSEVAKMFHEAKQNVPCRLLPCKLLHCSLFP